MTKNNIKELSIQVNLNGLSFCILNRTSNTVEYLKNFIFESKLTPFDVLNRLKTELSSNMAFADDFNEVLVIHQNELASLVPKQLYDDKYKADYLKFNSKILKTDFIATDELVINESINVYVPFVNINNFVFDTFGTFIYKHSSTVLIDSILQREENSETSKVFINVNTTSIELAVFNNKELQLFNVFEYYSKEDFIYYILFVFEQLKLDTETTRVELSGNIDVNDELYKTLYTYVRHVDLYKSNYSFNFSEEFDEKKLHNHHLILNSF
ncbi:DUF3822 family protein [Winogradskyella sp. A2]|uniref:DUF3822 family protein n=1 Tax=Winogradskyella sp. A2 TaxID=3366944 RepID=UPI00398C68E9